MGILFQSARIITATTDHVADVYVADATISRIEKSIDLHSVPPETTIISAAGRYLFPGFIDPHVHVHLPFMGTYAKDTWASASRAALLGGTTTLIEMICPEKGEEPMAAHETWMSKAEHPEEGSSCDFAFHMGVTRFDSLSECQLREIVTSLGTRSFKVFLAYKGALGIDDRELYHALKLARELDVIVTAHCENETLVAERQAELLEAGHHGPEFHGASRPVQVEAEGVQHLLTFAELTGTRVYIVHTSCDEAVQAAMRGLARGLDVKVEAVVPHLLLDDSATRKPGFEGAKFVMSPPLREAGQCERLWSHLRNGVIATVGTDHAPFDFATQKSMGRGDFTQIPNGIPSVQHRVELLYTHGVCAGRIDLHRLVECAATQPARIFGLANKGDIAVGMDADLVLFDPDYRGMISARTHAMAVDYSAFEGWPVTGRADLVTVRGIIVVRDGQFIGRPGTGRFIMRT